MSWATHYIEQLKAGKTVQFRPRGNSMEPKIRSGDLCTVEPISVSLQSTPLQKEDIVLCTVKGNDYLHLVKAIQEKPNGLRYQIGNNKGGINGWIGENRVYGKLIRVDN